MVFPWKRFWVPLESQISCGFFGEGFLDDPESEWNPNHEIARTVESLLATKCLILCGEPGLGKSVALEQAFPAVDYVTGGNASIIWVRFRDIPDSSAFTRRVFESTRWKSWIKSNETLTLVLDGLDEGLIKIKDFVSFLTSELQSVPRDRLKLIIACRTADWPFAAGNELLRLFGSELSRSLWELCPLRRIDAELAAEGFGVQKQPFLEQVFEKHVATLAARPVTLFFLLRQFAADGQLKGTHRDIYERGILDLCREPDPKRAEARRKQEGIAPEQLRDGAAYLAALLILSGRSAISTASHPGTVFEGDLNLESIFTYPEFPKVRDQKSIRASLDTALFSSRGENRLGFAHQTFAECLAARQVSNMPLAQLRELFCGNDGTNEHVVPQVAETAAWLAGANHQFLQHVLKIDPEVLLRSDIARIQGQTKKQIVAAVLDKASRLELFDDIRLRRFLSGLKHEGLAEQLWTYIQNPSFNIVARRLALEIAEDCRVEELNDRLLGIVCDATWDQQVREGAARTLHKTLPSHRVKALEPLGRGECEPDPDDEIKAHALYRLVPAVWSLAAALQYLTPPKNDHFHGTYYMFLHYEAPNRISVEDLPFVLPWLINIEHCFDILNPFSGLASRALTLALQNLQQLEIRQAIVRLWREKKRKYEHLSTGHRNDEVEALLGEDLIRRDLASAVFDDPETTEDDVAHLLLDSVSVLQARDLGWVLERLPAVNPNQLPVWTRIVSYLARPENIVGCWDLFLQRIQEIPNVRTAFSWLRAWDVDAAESRKAKADYLRDQRRRRRWNKRREGPHPKELIAKGLEEVAKGNYWQWINLSAYLSLKPGDTHYNAHLRHDVTQEPGWQAADEQTRVQIRNSAKQFLLRCKDGFQQLGARTNYCNPGYLAIWLLGDEINTNETLQAAVSRNWIDAIVGYFNNAEDHYQEMVALAYKLNPDATIDALRRQAEESFSRSGYVFAWRGFARCWDSALTAVLTEFVVSHTIKTEVFTSSLCFLLEADPSAFQNWMRRILPRVERLNQQAREMIVSIALALTPKEAWQWIWPVITSDDDFAKKVLLRVASDLEFESRKRRIDLGPSEMHMLAELVHRLFPPDAALERLSGIVTPRQAVADYRRRLSDTLTASPERAAGAALLALAQTFPDRRAEFLWRYQDHLKTRRRTLWQPPTPAELTALLARSESRFITTEGDLYQVVIESIGRFQEYFTKTELPAVDHVWRWDTEGRRKRNFEPKDEETLSDELARWFRDDLRGKGIIIGREVQIERKQKTDILVKAVAISAGAIAPDPVVVVVEVKGCWNPKVRTDAEDQLVQKYLLPHGWSCGIYVVGWFVCDAWGRPRNCLESKTFEDAQSEVAAIGRAVSAAHPELSVAGLLIDCRYR